VLANDASDSLVAGHDETLIPLARQLDQEADVGKALSLTASCASSTHCTVAACEKDAASVSDTTDAVTPNDRLDITAIDSWLSTAEAHTRARVCRTPPHQDLARAR
jgi:hypothetical protein